MITIYQRHRQRDRRTDIRTDGQTDDMRSQYRALHLSASRVKNDIILLRDRQYITQYVTSRASAVREQESLANAKVSARQQCVYEGPSEEIYDKLKQGTMLTRKLCYRKDYLAMRAI